MKTTIPALLSLLLVITCHISFAQKHSKESKMLAVQAQQYYDKGDYLTALDYYQKAEKLHPDDPHFAYAMGLCYKNLAYFQEALPNFEKAKAAGIKSTQLDYFLGECYHATLKLDKAIASFEAYKDQVKKKNPEEALKADKMIVYCNNAKTLVENPVSVRITNLGEKVNSKFDDYKPVISADETILIFTSRRDNSTGNLLDPRDNKYYEDIYIDVKHEDHEWTTPTPFTNVINSNSHDACVGLSADATQLFVYKPDNGGDLYISSLIGTIWAEPKNLGPNINSNAWEPSASISADGKTLFFTSNRTGGIGGNDIYFSKRLASGEFGPATLLSNKINTKENEFSPFIHPDGKTLYFSSMGFNSMGGYDIFSCTINPETGEILSDPVNVGYPINTPGDDIFFVWSADNKRAYFSSVRENGFGEQDIYMLERETTPDVHLSIVIGKVINCINNEPVHASITVTDSKTGQQLGLYTSNSTTGKYTVVLSAGASYKISIDAPGFSDFSKNIDLPADAKYSEINDTICLQSVNPGTKLVLRSVKYEVAKATLLPESNDELDRLVKTMNTNADMKVLIGVHTDSYGDDYANLTLTEERAKGVRDYLISKGIDSKRVFYKGFGETRPLVINDGEESSKAANRRTEIEILK